MIPPATSRKALVPTRITVGVVSPVGSTVGTGVTGVNGRGVGCICCAMVCGGPCCTIVCVCPGTRIIVCCGGEVITICCGGEVRTVTITTGVGVGSGFGVAVGIAVGVGVGICVGVGVGVEVGGVVGVGETLICGVGVMEVQVLGGLCTGGELPQTLVALTSHSYVSMPLSLNGNWLFGA